LKYGCLDSAEVYESGSGSCSSSRRKKGMARHSRSEDIGNYTRKELVRLTKDLRIELWTSLESKVAKALHLPRR
jgi:hypothetical protein